MSKVCGHCKEGDFLGRKFISRGKLTKFFGFDICKDCESELIVKYQDTAFAKKHIKCTHSMSVTSGLTPVRTAESRSLTRS